MLRLAGPADARHLLRWRNDPITRFFRDDPREITAEEHTAWLNRRQASESKVYIFEPDGEPLGNITLDVDGNRCEVGWIVAPEQREQGIATRMVNEALASVVHGQPWAKMREDNVASYRVALRCGFRERKRANRMIYCDHQAETQWNRMPAVKRAFP